MSLVILFFFGGVFKDDFFIDIDSVKAFQVRPAVAVHPNGTFTVAWEDSLHSLNSLFPHGYVRIRFFTKGGTPLGPSRRLSVDTIAGRPIVASDGKGFMCIWHEADKPYYWSLYGTVFDSTGKVIRDRFLITKKDSAYSKYYALSGCSKDGFMLVWQGEWLGFVGQRFDSFGNVSENQVTLYHPPHLSMRNPSVSLNSRGFAAVAWSYPYNEFCTTRFLTLDSANNKLISDSFRFVTDGSTRLVQQKTVPIWFDDDKFALIWLKYTHPAAPDDPVRGIQAKLFNQQCDSLSGIKTLLDDSYTSSFLTNCPLSVSSYHDGKYAVAFQRQYPSEVDPYLNIFRATGLIADTSLTRTTDIFRLSSFPTSFSDSVEEEQPCVDACDDQIVWVWKDNSRIRDDTFPYYTDIHCKITDWNVLGIDEPSSPVTPVAHQPSSELEITTPIGSEITLRYSNFTNGFNAQVYDASGRKVDELQSPQTQGTIRWGGGRGCYGCYGCYGPGVYFIVPEGSKTKPAKVVLVK